MTKAKIKKPRPTLKTLREIIENWHSDMDMRTATLKGQAIVYHHKEMLLNAIDELARYRRGKKK